MRERKRCRIFDIGVKGVYGGCGGRLEGKFENEEKKVGGTKGVACGRPKEKNDGSNIEIWNLGN